MGTTSRGRLIQGVPNRKWTGIELKEEIIAPPFRLISHALFLVLVIYNFDYRVVLVISTNRVVLCFVLSISIIGLCYLFLL